MGLLPGHHLIGSRWPSLSSAPALSRAFVVTNHGNSVDMMPEPTGQNPARQVSLFGFVF